MVDTWIELLDRLEGFKRFALVVPVELTFLIVVVIMAYRGDIQAALVAVTGILSGMIGYYFGTHQSAATTEGI